MGLQTETIGKHTITMDTRASGMEIILVDGIEVSQRRSRRPFSDHKFSVDEDGKTVVYDVRLAGPIGYVIRRDGIVVAEPSGWTRFVWGFLLGMGTSVLIEISFLGLSKALPDNQTLARTARLADDFSSLIALGLGGAFTIWIARRMRG